MFSFEIVNKTYSEKDFIFSFSNMDIEKEKVYQLFLKNFSSSDYADKIQNSMMKIMNDTRQFDKFNETYENISRRYKQSEPMFNVANSEAVLIFLTIIYAIIFVSGILGNVVTCIVILKNRGMHTAVNYYLGKLKMK